MALGNTQTEKGSVHQTTEGSDGLDYIDGRKGAGHLSVFKLPTIRRTKQ